MNDAILVVDTSASTATLAFGPAGRRGLERALPQKQTSERLLATIDALLGEGGVCVTDLAGMVAVRGPGSFTGLRIGLATLYGLHQATGVPAATITTLEALGRVHPTTRTAAAIVDALRGEWFVQTFRDGFASSPVPEPRVLPLEDLVALEIDTWIGFETPAPESESSSPRWLTPTNLAGDLLPHLDPRGLDWDASTLLEPLYLRAPAVTVARPHSTGRIR